MSQKKYILTIPEPCHEQWSQMTACGAGRFCGSCEKTVMDFTPLSDDSIVRILEGSQGNICGRFHKNQLNRIVAQTEIHPSFFSRMLKIAAGILLPAVLHPTLVKAQENIPQKTRTEQRDSMTVHGAKRERALEIGSSERKFSGRVIDKEAKEPLIGVSVFYEIGKEKIGTVTNLEGFFELEIPAEAIRDSLEIKFAYVGYELVTLFIQSENFPLNKEILMTPTDDENIVVVGGVCGHKPTFRSKVRRFFSRKY